MRIKSRLFGSRRRIAATLSTGLLLVCASAALAAWMATGTASFRGEAGTLTAPSITPAALATTKVYPGTSGTLDAVVSNPGPAQHVVSLSPSITITSNQPGCSNGEWDFNQPAITAALTGYVAPANATAVPLSIPNAISLSPLAPNACQGAPVTITWGPANSITWSQ